MQFSSLFPSFSITFLSFPLLTFLLSITVPFFSLCLTFTNSMEFSPLEDLEQ